MSPVTRPIAHPRRASRLAQRVLAVITGVALLGTSAPDALEAYAPGMAEADAPGMTEVAATPMRLASLTSSSGIVVTTAQIDEPGPLGSVSIIGDSVLLGASWEPSLPTRLAAQGWGPIRFRASGGGSTGFHLDDDHPASLRNWIRWWREGGWDAQTIIVNLGANDAGICSGSTARCRSAIEHLLTLIGPDRTVVWNRITHLYQSHQQAWNAALDAAAAEHPNLVLWDWPAAQVAHGIRLSGDRIHLADRAANQKRSEVMATEITELLTGADRVDTASIAWPVGAERPATMVSVPARRLLDTRIAMSAATPGRIVEVSLGDAVPTDATAVALGITAAGPTGDGYVTVWPCGEPVPDTSVVNVTTGRDRAAQAVVAIGTGDAGPAICARTSVATHLIVDLQSAFVPGDHGSGFVPATPRRLVDTRATSRRDRIVFDAPAPATALAVTLTAVGSSGPGYLGVRPCEDPPSTSVLNHGAGETVAGAAYVEVGASRRICVDVSADTDVLVDLTGTFRPGRIGLGLVTATPQRVLDTRTGRGGWLGVQGRDQTLDVIAAPGGAEAITGTITLVGPATQGFASAVACGTATETSSVNGARGAVMAAGVTVGVNARSRLCVRTSTPTHTLVDVTGWWVRDSGD